LTINKEVISTIKTNERTNDLVIKILAIKPGLLPDIGWIKWYGSLNVLRKFIRADVTISELK
tara:strand:- start:1140 stop:1325 length:186 start_codon:yes stop_codon:yes gene_type:complete